MVTSTHSLEVLQGGSSKYKQILIKGMGHTTPFAKFKKDICEVSEILKIPKEDKKEEEK